MRRWAFIAAGGLVFLLVATQLALPALIERQVEKRLTAGGGSAEVTLGAVPAARLLISDGARFEVHAHDLDLDLDPDEELEVFDRLDGFSTVAITIDDFRAGPFELEAFELTRDAPAPYALVASGRTSPAALVEYGVSNLGVPGGPLADLALDTVFGAAETAIPIELEMALVSEGGRIDAEGDATVAGFPAGPLAEVMAATIVARL